MQQQIISVLERTLSETDKQLEIPCTMAPACNVLPSSLFFPLGHGDKVVGLGLLGNACVPMPDSLVQSQIVDKSVIFRYGRCHTPRLKQVRPMRKQRNIKTEDNNLRAQGEVTTN